MPRRKDAQRSRIRSGQRRARNQRPRRPGRATLPASARFWWATLPQKELLNVRFCDLNLSIAASPLPNALKRLYAELERRGLRLRPTC